MFEGRRPVAVRAVRDREPRPGAYDSRVWYSASVARECGGSYGDRVSRLDDGIEWGNLFS